MNKCIFLDRDGVLNVERGDYTYRLQDFQIIDGVPEAIEMIKAAGYLAIVVTNQAGIARGLYSREQMQACHDLLMEKTHFLIDKIYYSPWHPSVTESLSRKPGTLMIEKAMARYAINPDRSWLVGDRCRDIICGQRKNLKTVLIGEKAEDPCTPTYYAPDLRTAVRRILAHQ